ncbi:hypothetical protein [Nitrosococcus wardiae]|uniref:Tc toxin complex TcA C-terminal TcB-binding domain-containing protein n=1 Tax=Nitrosococcus wardiae TaxID=1814290 RepID=A0A4V1AW29_9GAMM|nr:hypothetical protein [Nitrosococcus wardiae]QBQ55195.1 hypothetical protein E3U44_12255 [Nitrosococcus wardiae]
MLEIEEIKQGPDPCSDPINQLQIDVELKHEVPEEWMPSFSYIMGNVSQVQHPEIVQTAITEINTMLAADASWENRMKGAQMVAEKALSQNGTSPKTVGSAFADSIKALDSAFGALLRDNQVFDSVKNVGINAGKGSAVSSAPYQNMAMSLSQDAFSYCISPNPIPRTLRLRAELNLHKLRTCRNITGMKRTLEPYAAPTDQISGLPQIGARGQLLLPGATTIVPTPYRFSFLIDRAKQILGVAQQMEAAMLAALEKRDAETYSRLKSKQDIELAGVQVTLQSLRVKEAEDGVQLAGLQKERAQIQVDQYETWLLGDLSANEKANLQHFEWVAASYKAASLVYWGFTEVSRSAEFAIKMLETKAQILAQQASYERRAQQWEFEKSLAEQDVRIGAQQVTIAEDHVRVVGQERTIALMQKDHAKDTAEFLANKFTNVELYDWMSGILEDVYSYFLQEATAVARLAENQLAFERQVTPPNYIRQDYGEAPSEDMVATTLTPGKTIDRRGLTGSARLLQDIYQLDQYAIETDKRKLQLTKTISLAALSPVEFQRFQEKTGVITFRTPQELFDRDFPGHYLRLIKRSG